MRILAGFARVLAALGGVAAIGYATAAPAATDPTTLSYAVMRNGQPIGTTTMRLMRAGARTNVTVATEIRVKIAFFTVYRFDQRESERWDGGRLIAMNAVTDDNGTVHRVKARLEGAQLAVDADGRVSRVDAAVIPDSLWNARLVKQTLALNLENGRLTPIRVVDRGEERLVLQGRPTLVHHYSIDAGFPQDVWYDQHHRLVKVELRGSDGSQIVYRLG